MSNCDWRNHSVRHRWPPVQAAPPLPPAVLRAGERTSWRFVDFFTSSIRNPHTREAYYRAVTRFLAWCEDHGLAELAHIRPIHVAAYVEQLDLARPSVKQHLAAIRKCFNWLLSGGVIEQNPASPVQGPKYIVRQGKTPVLDATQTRELLDSIPLDTVVGLRDRALIAVMVFTFGRVGAVTAMDRTTTSADAACSGSMRRGARNTSCRPTIMPSNTWRTTWTGPSSRAAPSCPCSSR